MAILPNFLELVRAKSSDAEELTSLAHVAKRSWNYPEAWIESWREQLTVTAEFIRDHETVGCRIKGVFVGFYALSRRSDAMEFSHFWVLPAWQHQGVGRSLFQDALDRLRRSGISKLEIEADPNAAGFYERLGARRVRVNRYPFGGDIRELPVLVYELEKQEPAGNCRDC